ncbi:hypothetical protein, partial [Oceanivirga salmonicida]|uniref:hypothetical protein n=1 Tax=Oceanivirga salmonicida TaxID=1769291 RepID=UPI0018D26E1D
KLENIGKIEDFGKLKKIWKDKDGKVYDEKDVEKWQIRKELTVHGKPTLGQSIEEFQKGILNNFSSKFGEGYDKNFRKSHKEGVTKALTDGNKEKKSGNIFAQYIRTGEKEIIPLKSDYEVVGQKIKLSEL